MTKLEKRIVFALFAFVVLFSTRLWGTQLWSLICIAAH